MKGGKIISSPTAQVLHSLGNDTGEQVFLSQGGEGATSSGSDNNFVFLEGNKGGDQDHDLDAPHADPFYDHVELTPEKPRRNKQTAWTPANGSITYAASSRNAGSSRAGGDPHHVSRKRARNNTNHADSSTLSWGPTRKKYKLAPDESAFYPDESRRQDLFFRGYDFFPYRTWREEIEQQLLVEPKRMGVLGGTDMVEPQFSTPGYTKNSENSPSKMVFQELDENNKADKNMVEQYRHAIKRYRKRIFERVDPALESAMGFLDIGCERRRSDVMKELFKDVRSRFLREIEAVDNSAAKDNVDAAEALTAAITTPLRPNAGNGGANPKSGKPLPVKWDMILRKVVAFAALPEMQDVVLAVMAKIEQVFGVEVNTGRKDQFKETLDAANKKSKTKYNLEFSQFSQGTVHALSLMEDGDDSLSVSSYSSKRRFITRMPLSFQRLLWILNLRLKILSCVFEHFKPMYDSAESLFAHFDEDGDRILSKRDLYHCLRKKAIKRKLRENLHHIPETIMDEAIAHIATSPAAAVSGEGASVGTTGPVSVSAVDELAQKLSWVQEWQDAKLRRLNMRSKVDDVHDDATTSATNVIERKILPLMRQWVEQCAEKTGIVLQSIKKTNRVVERRDDKILNKILALVGESKLLYQKVLFYIFQAAAMKRNSDLLRPKSGTTARAHRSKFKGRKTKGGGPPTSLLPPPLSSNSSLGGEDNNGGFILPPASSAMPLTQPLSSAGGQEMPPASIPPPSTVNYHPLTVSDGDSVNEDGDASSESSLDESPKSNVNNASEMSVHWPGYMTANDYDPYLASLRTGLLMSLIDRKVLRPSIGGRWRMTYIHASMITSLCDSSQSGSGHLHRQQDASASMSSSSSSPNMADETSSGLLHSSAAHNYGSDDEFESRRATPDHFLVGGGTPPTEHYLYLDHTGAGYCDFIYPETTRPRLASKVSPGTPFDRMSSAASTVGGVADKSFVVIGRFGEQKEQTASASSSSSTNALSYQQNMNTAGSTTNTSAAATAPLSWVPYPKRRLEKLWANLERINASMDRLKSIIASEKKGGIGYNSKAEALQGGAYRKRLRSLTLGKKELIQAFVGERVRVKNPAFEKAWKEITIGTEVDLWELKKYTKVEYRPIKFMMSLYDIELFKDEILPPISGYHPAGLERQFHNMPAEEGMNIYSFDEVLEEIEIRKISPSYTFACELQEGNRQMFGYWRYGAGSSSKGSDANGEVVATRGFISSFVDSKNEVWDDDAGLVEVVDRIIPVTSLDNEMELEVSQVLRGMMIAATATVDGHNPPPNQPLDYGTPSQSSSTPQASQKSIASKEHGLLLRISFILSDPFFLTSMFRHLTGSSNSWKNPGRFDLGGVRLSQTQQHPHEKYDLGSEYLQLALVRCGSSVGDFFEDSSTRKWRFNDFFQPLPMPPHMEHDEAQVRLTFVMGEHHPQMQEGIRLIKAVLLSSSKLSDFKLLIPRVDGLSGKVMHDNFLRIILNHLVLRCLWAKDEQALDMVLRVNILGSHLSCWPVRLLLDIFVNVCGDVGRITRFVPAVRRLVFDCITKWAERDIWTHYKLLRLFRNVFLHGKGHPEVWVKDNDAKFLTGAARSCMQFVREGGPALSLPAGFDNVQGLFRQMYEDLVRLYDSDHTGGRGDYGFHESASGFMAFEFDKLKLFVAD